MENNYRNSSNLQQTSNLKSFDETCNSFAIDSEEEDCLYLTNLQVSVFQVKGETF